MRRLIKWSAFVIGIGILLSCICGLISLGLQSVGILPDYSATEEAEETIAAVAAVTREHEADLTATIIALTPTDTPTSTSTPTATFTASDTPIPSPTPLPTNTVPPSDTPGISPTIPTASRTPTPLEATIYNQVEGVAFVQYADIAPSMVEGTLADFEIYLLSGYNSQQTADRLYQVIYQQAILLYGSGNVAPVQFSAILWDGDGPAIDWRFDNETNSWQRTELSITPDITFAAPTNTSVPTRTPQPTITAPAPTQSVCTQFAVPRSCATAVHYGLDARTIAECWPERDGDGDGVACYGD